MWKKYKKELIVSGFLVGIFAFAIGCVFGSNQVGGVKKADKKYEQHIQGDRPGGNGFGNDDNPGTGNRRGHGREYGFGGPGRGNKGGVGDQPCQPGDNNMPGQPGDGNMTPPSADQPSDNKDNKDNSQDEQGTDDSTDSTKEQNNTTKEGTI